jgi:hypothetical protein
MKAFPSENDSNKQYNYLEKGMDLRDYFAAKIMQGFVQGLVNIDKEDDQKTSEITAIMAYKFADEMMEARNATK